MNRVALEQAVDWMLLLRSGKATPQDRVACDAWRTSDVEHERAWQSAATHIDGPFERLQSIDSRMPGQIDGARRALLVPRRRRQFIGELLGLSAVALGAAAVTHRLTPLDGLTADLRAGTGERRSFTLNDGSTVWLNARSSANVSMDGPLRRLWLQAGDVLADISPIPGRLFRIDMDGPAVEAARGRVLVRRHGPRIVSAALTHDAILHLPGGSALPLVPGQGVMLEDGRLHSTPVQADASAAWVDGRLEVSDQPLSDVIAELRLYSPGFLRVSPEAGALRVHGSFPLDDTDAVLTALAETLPIRIRRAGALWVMIERV